jgi:hypothetical protein
VRLRAIARAFEVRPKDVRHALAEGGAIPKGCGAHHALEGSTEERLLEWIANNAKKHTPVNRMEVLHYCRETLGAVLTKGWVDFFLISHQTEFFETTSRPQENPRFEIPRSLLDAMLECLRQQVQDRCAELVFNLDEVGISEWEDGVARKAIVPVSMSGQTIHHGAHYNLKHISLVRCVSANGESMIPFMVSLQVNDSDIERLKAERFRMAVDFILERRQKPYMTAALFQQYVTTVMIPFINPVWTNDQFAEKPAISLMDNCSIHARPEVLKILREHDVKMIAFQPHTTQIFQSLALSLFGGLK